MNKKYGILEDFALVRKDISRTVIGYGLTPETDGEHYTWYDVVIYKKVVSDPNIEQVKSAVEGDINARTDKKILSGFVWNGKPVWLSSENQFNYKAAYDLAAQTDGASLPVKFKLGEDEEGNPVYHTFTSLNAFTDFYTKAIGYINQCLNDGWNEKDSINWEEYVDALENPVIDGFPEPEPEPEPEPTPDPEPTPEPEPSEDEPSEDEETPSEDETPEETPEEDVTPEEEPAEEPSDEETQEEPKKKGK